MAGTFLARLFAVCKYRPHIVTDSRQIDTAPAPNFNFAWSAAMPCGFGILLPVR